MIGEQQTTNQIGDKMQKALQVLYEAMASEKPDVEKSLAGGSNECKAEQRNCRLTSARLVASDLLRERGRELREDLHNPRHILLCSVGKATNNSDQD